MVEKGLRQSHMAVVTSAFSKSSVFPVHTNILSRRFQIYPLWRAFSKSFVFGHRKRRFGVDGRPIRIKKVAFSIYPASCVRTESKSQQNIELMAFALTWCANIFVGCSVTPTFFFGRSLLFLILSIILKNKKICTWEV